MSDLTPTEQINVRTALVFLRARCGGWDSLAKMLRVSQDTVARPPTASLTFRLARLVQVSVDDLLAGRYPSGDVCPRCGHRKGEEGDAADRGEA